MSLGLNDSFDYAFQVFQGICRQFLLPEGWRFFWEKYFLSAQVAVQLLVKAEYILFIDPMVCDQQAVYKVEGDGSVYVHCYSDTSVLGAGNVIKYSIDIFPYAIPVNSVNPF